MFLVTISEGLWVIFHKFAAPHINQIVGAITVSFTAVVLWVSLWAYNYKNIQLFTNIKGVIFIVLAGVAAFFIDFFMLQAFSRGLPMNVGGPIVIAGGTFIVVMVGFWLGESVTFLKILGLCLVLVGAYILSVVE